jgi:hypothetical protein
MVILHESHESRRISEHTLAEYLPDPNPDDWPELSDAHTFALTPDHRIVRIYRSEGRHKVLWHQPRHWGPTTARFDHHPEGPPQDYRSHSVWYGALEIDDGEGNPTGVETAVAERFQDSHIVPLSDPTMSLVICEVDEDTHLLDMDSAWLTQAGGNSAIAAGPRDRSRAWARQIHEKYPVLQGVVWKSSVYPPGRSMVLWNQKDGALAEESLLNRPLSLLRSKLIPVARHLKYKIAWETDS